MKILILTLALVFSITSLSQEIVKYDMVHIKIDKLKIESFIKPFEVKRIVILPNHFIVDHFSEKEHTSYSITKKEYVESKDVYRYIVKDELGSEFVFTRDFNAKTIEMYIPKDDNHVVYFEI